MRSDVAAHGGGGHIGQDHGKEEGRHPHPAAVGQNAAVLLQGREPAVAVAQDHSHPVRVVLGDVVRRRFHGLETGRDGQLGEAGHPPRFLVTHVISGVEAADLTGNLAGIARWVAEGHGPDARCSRGQVLPIFLRVLAQWGHGPHSGDYYPNPLISHWRCS